jgi:hypothetical protein
MSSSVPARPHALRWVVAVLVTIAMLVVTTGLAVFAQSGTSGGPVFAPATTVAYAELRLDLPGDQRDQLVELLGHLPGFADPAAFDTKVNELLDQVVSEASGGGATWTADIEPWSNRQLAIALLDLPTSAGPQETPNTLGLDPGDDDGGPPPVVVGLGVKDRAALESRLALFLTQAPIATEQYAGATITTVGDDVSYAVTDEYLLVAPDAEDLKASLDVLAGTAPGLAEDPVFAAAATRIPADRLGAFYLALGALRPLLESQLSGQPGTELVLDALDQLPAWITGYAQASSDHLTLSVDVQAPASLPVPSVRETDLAGAFPSGTVVYLELRDLGSTLHATLDTLLAQLPADDTEELESIERILGARLPEFLDPVQDAALGLTIGDGTFQAGIAATLVDPEAAQARVANLLALVRVLGSGADSPYSVTEAQVAGVTVTTITFAVEGGARAFDLPITPAISVAVSGDHLYLGLGDFAASALTQDAASSLASDARFANAVTIAGTPNSGLLFVDIAGAQALAESFGLDGDEDYVTNVKPWLDALDFLVLSASAADGVINGKALLFVR